jgi:hypothetical protein
MQELTKQGKWSDWISNEGNAEIAQPKGFVGDLDTLVNIVLRGGSTYEDTVSYWDWSDEGSDYCVKEYRYWIPEKDEVKPETTQDSEKKHSHYFKDVSKLDYIDVYRVIDLFKIKHPCLQHAVKKLLVSGGRGHKDEDRDIQDVIDSCVRWQEMRKEDKE